MKDKNYRGSRLYEASVNKRKDYKTVRKRRYEKLKSKKTLSDCFSVLFMLIIVIGVIITVSSFLSACSKESSSYFKLEQSYIGTPIAEQQ